ncbi:tRNA epoxyqueuosine(34) reductase QueG [Pontibacillus yanchengensis]|uniref:Epoxyqueuosine reductase n=2 Tax=Pontibacillus yanchengensis TaxID=462910 RepID=A0A6I4ZV09_9BACI|nr:tRNA epoxyqueuosine(34) reductase QueG [Pontibacillus yanchengensis]MYL32546.1 tRNA epoxyqueuosine(34) reductase QueG [Pontibacillus yanchengensis]MYL53127.1 tRNA epoxyqueuosine(34) reductase QueG [Pontibacillus yanchengensis]
MDIHAFKEDMIAYSKEIGIDKIGIASPDVFTELKERLRTQQELGYQSGFEKGSLEERTEPKRHVTEAKSIISIALAYPSKLKNAPRSTKEERRGIFCRASWGQDYHDVLNDRLEKLAAYLKEKYPGFTWRSMVDTGELSDRAVAERAGIGFTGKNTNLITPEYGSYVYLGEMITNIPFPPDDPVDDSCGDCNICVDACPTGALVQGNQLNAQKCIAFLTQTKGFLPDEYRGVIGNRIYGCDTCQTVCPKNKKKDFHLHEELEPDPEVVKPKLKPLLSISNREFKETFGHISGSWRGKKPLQRNAILALAHYKDENAVEELVRVMNQDPRPVIRGTAAWALGKIGVPSSHDEILLARDKEEDEEVLEEMEKGLRYFHPLNK